VSLAYDIKRLDIRTSTGRLVYVFNTLFPSSQEPPMQMPTTCTTYEAFGLKLSVFLFDWLDVALVASVLLV
jgi:hypothetical protein